MKDWDPEAVKGDHTGTPVGINAAGLSLNIQSEGFQREGKVTCRRGGLIVSLLFQTDLMCLAKQNSGPPPGIYH